MSGLAKLLEPQLEQLIERWTQRISEGLAPDGLSEPVLRDHIKDVLRELVRTLHHGAVPDTLQSAEKHGKQRYHAGFQVDALVREYGVLRDLIFELAEEANLGLKMPEVRTLTDFIATAIADGVAEYDQQRARAEKRLTQGLREQETQLRAVLESTAEGIWGVDQRGICTFANPASLRFLGGVSAEEMVGRDLHQAPYLSQVPGSERDLAELLDRVLETGFEARGDDVRMRRADGTTFPVRYSISPMQLGDRQEGAVIAFEDITDRKQAEDAQRALSGRLTTALAAGGLGTFEWDHRTDDIALDARSREIFALPTAQPLTSQELFGRIHPEDLARVQGEMQATLSSPSARVADYRIAVPDGSPRSVRSVAEVVRDPSGQAARIIGVLRDVTEEQARTEERERELAATRLARAEAEHLTETIRSQELELRRILDALPFLVSFVSSDERYGLVNKSYEEWFGIPQEQLRGQTIREVIGEPAYAVLSPYVRRGLAGEHVVFEQHDVPYRLGGLRDIRVSFVPRITQDGRVEGYVALLEDITERRRLTQERELLARQRTDILESMGDAFFALDRDWRVLLVNHAFEQLTGQPRDACLGQPFWALFPEANHPESPYFQHYHRCMQERVPVAFVDHTPSLDRWLEAHAFPTSEGGISVFLRDVSLAQRASAALQKQAHVEQQLIGIVSHDLRNPLNAILIGATALSARDELDSLSLRIVTRLRSSAERAARMTRDLLDFTQARLGGGIPVRTGPCDIHSLVRQVIEEVETAHPGREVQLRQQGDGRGDWDADRVTQAFGNLLTNALKYSPPGTPVRVDCAPHDGWLQLAVHNLGPPIPTEQLAHLFEPMRRATADVERMGRSVGLGLYIVQQIAEAHGGQLDVSSTTDGTTFTLRLPQPGVPRA